MKEINGRKARATVFVDQLALDYRHLAFGFLDQIKNEKSLKDELAEHNLMDELKVRALLQEGLIEMDPVIKENVGQF